MASLARLLIRTFCVLLMAVFGTVASFAAPGNWMRISYPVVAQELSAQPSDLTNSARAPPTAIANVMATGTAFAQTGNLRALDGVETHLASFGFGVGLDAPNTGFGSADEAFDAISDFRSRTTITDAQGGTGTVAVTEINGQRYFGVNSTNLSDADRNLGRQWRDRLGLTRGQDQVVFHAEAHSLMRAYERTNGNMPSNLTLYVDRNSCGVCQTYLPRMADEMGVTNLNLSFTSGRSGVIRNGAFEWLD